MILFFLPLTVQEVMCRIKVIMSHNQIQLRQLNDGCNYHQLYRTFSY